jgi:hypothetical protein
LRIEMASRCNPLRTTRTLPPSWPITAMGSGR